VTEAERIQACQLSQVVQLLAERELAGSGFSICKVDRDFSNAFAAALDDQFQPDFITDGIHVDESLKESRRQFLQVAGLAVSRNDNGEPGHCEFSRGISKSVFAIAKLSSGEESDH